MIVVVICVSLLPLTASLVDRFPVLNQYNCNTCPSVYAPICTTNELTFTNECRLKCYNDALAELNKMPVYIDYYGTCVSTFVAIGVQVPASYDGNANK